MDFIPNDKWKEITKENEAELKLGDLVAYHNGYEWNTITLTSTELNYRCIFTGIGSESISFTGKFNKGYVFVPSISDKIYTKISSIF
jgi:hypothetical protein